MGGKFTLFAFTIRMFALRVGERRWQKMEKLNISCLKFQDKPYKELHLSKTLFASVLPQVFLEDFFWRRNLMQVV